MYHVRAIMSLRNWHINVINVVNAQRSTCIPSELTQIQSTTTSPESQIEDKHKSTSWRALLSPIRICRRLLCHITVHFIQVTCFI